MEHNLLQVCHRYNMSPRVCNFLLLAAALQVLKGSKVEAPAAYADVKKLVGAPAVSRKDDKKKKKEASQQKVSQPAAKKEAPKPKKEATKKEAAKPKAAPSTTFKLSGGPVTKGVQVRV
jgi:hypothetical protein